MQTTNAIPPLSSADAKIISSALMEGHLATEKRFQALHNQIASLSEQADRSHNLQFGSYPSAEKKALWIAYMKEGTRKNGRCITSSWDAWEVIQASCTKSQSQEHDSRPTHHCPYCLGSSEDISQQPSHDFAGKHPSVHLLNNLACRYSLCRFPVISQALRFYQAVVAGLYEFHAVLRQ